MRHFTILLLLVPLYLNAQEIPKRTNLAEIKCENMDGLDLMMNIGRAFINEGHQFDSVDKDFLTLSTNPKLYNKSMWFKYNISVNKDVASLRAYNKLPDGSASALGIGRQEFKQIMLKSVPPLKDIIQKMDGCSFNFVKE